jgi:predicted O-linked N-acetylglucosamine transferase (SPINDLY family)
MEDFSNKEAQYRRQLAARPDDWAALFSLAGVLRLSGRPREAAAAYRRVTQIKSDYAAGFVDLGLVLAEMSEPREAAAALRRACELAPDDWAGYFHLGNVLKSQGDLEGAAAELKRAANLGPQHLWTHSNLGDVLRQLGRIEEAIFSYDCALSIQPDFIPALSGRLYALHFDSRCEAEFIFQEHTAAAQPISRQIHCKQFPLTNDPDPERRIRVGYVSPDLRGHSVAFFIEPLLANHDPNQVDLFCYADLPKSDAVSERIYKNVPNWRPITGSNDENVIQMVRKDRIDILVDLAGHTANHRLGVFACKPAPVQVTYLGYPDTTGLRSIDYRLTDHFVDPPALTEKLYTETLERLPGSFAVYRPPAAAGAVGPLPAMDKGFVTFANFNGLAKMSAGATETWGKILASIANSRMVIAATGLQSERVQAEIVAVFARQGVDADRLTLLPQQPMSRYFGLHNEVDISLDSFPVQGHTVTCHSLWMGVPVVCVAGNTCSQRLAVSALSQLNLRELIAQTAEEYVKIAVELAADQKRLAALRDGLRERMKASPLMQGRTLAENIEAAYRRMWRRWCSAH